jgi:glyoxylase-like metal-dependent hydrolase (beta-lactamase superfamily II)
MSSFGDILFLYLYIMKVHRSEVGPFAENTYLLTEKQTMILVDPGFSVESEFSDLRSIIQESDAELKAVILTHAHIDHVMGIHRVRSAFDVPVYLCHEDLFLWNNFSDQSRMFGLSQPAFGFTPVPLPTEGEITIGDLTLECLFTPGHAPDHLSFYHQKSGALISGDAIFRESVGRTDLYKGDMELLKQSIRQKLFSLPDDTVVYPGHGPATTIGHEKRHNPFVGEGVSSF